jgi:hypothetical protein
LLDDNRIASTVGALVQNQGLYRSMRDIGEYEPENKGVNTGLNYLDKLVCGFRPGKFSIIAGYSGHGKTSLMLTTAIYNMSYETPCLFITCDDTDDMILAKVLAMQEGLSTEEIEAKGPKWRGKKADELEGMLQICSPQNKSGYSSDDILRIYEEVTDFWDTPPVFAGFDYLSLLELGREGVDERGSVIAKARRLKDLARRTDDTAWVFGHQCKKDAGADCPALLLNHLEYGGHQEADGVVVGCRRRITATKMADWELILEEETPTTNVSVLKNKVTGKTSPNPVGTVYVIDAVSGIIRDMTEEERRARDSKGKLVPAGPLGGLKLSGSKLSQRIEEEEDE